MVKERKRDLPERSFKLAISIVKLCKQLRENSDVFYDIIRQLLKAGTSVGANIEEGESSQSEADFLTKYSIACKECREAK
ncbi:MAG: four helix bundle protein [Chitinispirillia bacterium]